MKALLNSLGVNNDENLEIMQAIDAAYDRLFKILKDQHENNYSSDNASAGNKMLNKIIRFDGIAIELVGV